MGILDSRGKLAGRKALIIGGAGGIGKAVTLALAEAGVDVAFCDVDSKAVGSTAIEVRALGRQVVAEIADATDRHQLQRFYDVVDATFGLAASDLAKSVTGQVIHVDGGTAAALGMLRWPFDGDVTLPVPAAGTLTKLFGSS